MKVLDWWGIQCYLPSTLDSLLLQLSGMVQGKFQRLAWRVISSSTTWGIWLLRNKIVFKKGTISLFDCFSIILYQVVIWLHILNSNFTYTRNDLLRSFDGIKLWCNKKILGNLFVFCSSRSVLFFCFFFFEVCSFFFYLVPVFYFGYWFNTLFNILSMIFKKILKTL